jgi:hypothetical protein
VARDRVAADRFGRLATTSWSALNGILHLGCARPSLCTGDVVVFLAPLDDSQAIALGIGGAVALSMQRGLEGAKAFSNTQTALRRHSTGLCRESVRDWMKVKNPNSPAMTRARETEW